MTPDAAVAKKGGNGLILGGLMLGVLLAALDQTIVGTSLPKIVADLRDFEHFSALITGYLLASTIVIPVAGKFSDLYGRRPVYLAGMAVFLIGSALCGLAGQWGDWHVGGLTVTGMNQLVLFRFVQGLGGGAIFPVAIATIADLYAPSERGRVQGLFGAVFGLSSVIGPFLGGWIVDSVHVADIASWRWVFYVNLPIGAAAIAMVATHFPRKAAAKDIRIDWLGIAAITTAITSIILVAEWGGSAYAWGSWQVLGLLALTVGATVGFVAAERRARDPVIPLHLFRERIFTLSVVASVIFGSAMFGVISFLPTYMQGVVGISATFSGAVLMPLSLTMVAGSIVSGRLMAKHGYKRFMVAGAVIVTLGFGLLYAIAARGAPPVWQAVLVMIVLGLGLGFTLQTFVIAVQNAVERRYVGAGTSSVTLFRTLGATAGIAALGALLNRRLESELPARMPPGSVERLLADPNLHLTSVADLPRLLVTPQFLQASFPGHDAVVQGLKDGFGASISWVWAAGILLGLVALLVVVFVEDRPLKTAQEFKDEAAKVPTLQH